MPIVMDDPMSSFATAFTVPSPPPATMIWLFSFTARRASSEISAPLGASRMRAGVPFSANIRESFSRSSAPGWQPEALLRMQVKPEDSTWFHCFQIAELYLCATRPSIGISSSERKSITHMSPIERRYTSQAARAASPHARRCQQRTKTSVFLIRCTDSSAFQIRKH